MTPKNTSSRRPPGAGPVLAAAEATANAAGRLYVMAPIRGGSPLAQRYHRAFWLSGRSWYIGRESQGAWRQGGNRSHRTCPVSGGASHAVLAIVQCVSSCRGGRRHGQRADGNY